MASGWHLVRFKININFTLTKVLSFKLKFCWHEIASLWFMINFKAMGEMMYFKYWGFQSYIISQPLRRKKNDYQLRSYTVTSSSIWEKSLFSKNILKHELYIIFETFKYGFLYNGKGMGYLVSSMLSNFSWYY